MNLVFREIRLFHNHGEPLIVHSFGEESTSRIWKLRCPEAKRQTGLFAIDRRANLSHFLNFGIFLDMS